MRSVVILTITSLFFLGFTVGECPNGCSGQGTCSARDQCNCDKNYEGNDCSLRTCPHAYAFIDTPKGELNMDGNIKSSWELTDSQQWPAQGYEFFNPDAVNGEAHFYMECANRGLCDRESGTCQCFEGYDGSACQRTVCPNDCSGHGSCESISELSSKRGGQLFHKDTYHGDQSYSLWDQKVSYGCKCDPGFFGADCTRRRCKVGIDPMYEAAATEIVDTVHFRFATKGGTFNTNSYVRVRFFDYWGESYQTKRIAFGADQATTATALTSALLALPNGVITDVTCAGSGNSVVNNVVDPSGSMEVVFGTDFTHGYYIGCQFTSNPGILRLPEITQVSLTGTSISDPYAMITGSTQRGEDIDLTGKIDTATVTALSGTSMTTSGTSLVSDFALGTSVYLIKVQNQYLAVTAKTGGTGWTIGSAFPLAAISSGSVALFYQPSAMTRHDTNQVISAWALGATSFTAGTAPPPYGVGATVFVENQIFQVVSISSTTVTVDRPFAGISNTGAAIASSTELYYFANHPTTDTFMYVSECSGRGLCDIESGVCQCFKGYTNDNCDTQNILAF